MIRLYNTLGKKLETFEPLNGKTVKMFVCGPTVYDYSHLGHAKTYTQFDFLARFLKYSGFEVNYLQNITDIDDKIIKRAKERNIEPSALAEEFEKYYLEDMQTLGNTSVTKYARAHDYIDNILSQVERLVEKGYAYKISDGYYFNIKKFADYGKLSGRQNLEENDAVSRIDENPEKINAGDFCLWKFRKEGDPYWSTSLGDGRPGWHIEDTAITEQEFGPQYDLHGGAIDLIFPHHEAEIAQMESVSGKKPFVKYWVHTGFLNTQSEKMSKSSGNFKTIRNIIAEGVYPLALRFFFLGAHYRSPMNFNLESLESSQNAYRKLKEFFATLPDGGKLNEQYKNEFKEVLENDLNTPEALAVVWKLVKDELVSQADKKATLTDFDRVLGFKLSENEFEVKDIPIKIKNLLDERKQARRNKDWAKADALREEIKTYGFEVKDSENDQILSKI